MCVGRSCGLPSGTSCLEATLAVRLDSEEGSHVDFGAEETASAKLKGDKEQLKGQGGWREQGGEWEERAGKGEGGIVYRALWRTWFPTPQPPLNEVVTRVPSRESNTIGLLSAHRRPLAAMGGGVGGPDQGGEGKGEIQDDPEYFEIW